MIQIKYKGIFLDIEPGQEAQLTRNSPLFMLDVLTGEYSTPINIAYSDKNSLALGHIFFDMTVKSKMKLSVELYWKYTFLEAATLVIESAGMNRDIAGKSAATGYVLTGISDFFSLIKDKLLTDLILGGDRVMLFTTADPDDGSNGFIQKIKATWAFSDDYVVVPCRNELFDGTDAAGSNDFMNKRVNSLNNFQPDYIVPFPKLSYVLTQIFAEFGWTADFTGLAGTDWDKIILFSAYAVSAGLITYNEDGTILNWLPNISIFINLSKAMAQDKKVSYFVMQMCLRYGWVPLANASTHTCRFVALKNIINGTIKNWTAYSSATVLSNFNTDPKIFAFKNSFEGDDQLPSSIDTTGYTIGLPVASKANLPTPDAVFDLYIIYALKENQWFKIDIDNTTNTRIWTVFGDNIYDEDVPNATDTFDTAVTTLPTLYTEYSPGIFGFFPACRQSRFAKWGIRTLLYLGVVPACDESGNPLSFQYPLASSCNIDNQGNKILQWANVYKHAQVTDDGIIPFWFNGWTNIIKSTEEVKRRYYLPQHELLRFNWDDIIVDNNVQYLLKSFVQNLSYAGYIEATMQRIVLGDIAVIDETGDLIYFKLVWENLVAGQTITGPYENYTNATTGDVVIYCYADAAGTVPFTPINIKISFGINKFVDGAAPPPIYLMPTINTQRTVFYTNILRLGDNTTTGKHDEYVYSIAPGTGYGVI